MGRKSKVKADEQQSAEQQQQSYEVGYRKPPSHSQFSADNQPDNRGRKPGSTTFKKEAINLLRGMSDAMGSELSPMGILARQLIALCVSAKVNGQEVSPNVKLAALREILDRLEGKPLQSIIVDDESNIQLPLEWIIPIEVLDDSNEAQPKTEGSN